MVTEGVLRSGLSSPSREHRPEGTRARRCQARSRGFPTAATPSDPHLERERFVYKWQVFLGGVASATFVLAGAAAPALAQSVASSPLTSVIQSVTGAQVTGDVCTMAGLPLTGE